MRRIASRGAAAAAVAALSLGIAPRVAAQPAASPTPRSHFLFGTSGLFVGGAAGAAVPYGAFGDAGYDAGFHGDVAVGWQRPEHALGVRALLTVDRVSATASNPSRAAPRIDAATADVVVRAPLTRSVAEGFGVSLYALGGTGAYRIRGFDGTGPFADLLGGTPRDGSVVRWGVELGGGVAWGLGPAAVYAESRWVNVFTGGSRAGNAELRWVPFVLGLVFR